jgi:uncharacterized glyoxalase superfamily protein PhnB/quinol monooxygenase YgiN
VSDIARHHQIHGVQPVLPVPDVAAAADWFCRVLGFEVDFLFGEPVPVHGRVKAGDGSWGAPVFIHLQRREGDIVPCGETRLHVGHDIDALHAHALAQGATVLQPPADQPWGLREMVLRAPGGHRLVLGAEAAGAHGQTMPRAVIACYRPKPGQAAALLDIVRRHVPTLQRLGLASDRAPATLEAADGTLLEVFEWASAQAIEAAHAHPEVQAMWAAFETACEHVSLSQLSEAQGLFAEFTPLPR